MLSYKYQVDKKANFFFFTNKIQIKIPGFPKRFTL